MVIGAKRRTSSIRILEDFLCLAWSFRTLQMVDDGDDLHMPHPI